MALTEIINQIEALFAAFPEYKKSHAALGRALAEARGKLAQEGEAANPQDQKHILQPFAKLCAQLYFPETSPLDYIQAHFKMAKLLVPFFGAPLIKEHRLLTVSQAPQDLVELLNALDEKNYEQVLDYEYLQNLKFNKDRDSFLEKIFLPNFESLFHQTTQGKPDHRKVFIVCMQGIISEVGIKNFRIHNAGELLGKLINLTEEKPDAPSLQEMQEGRPQFFELLIQTAVAKDHNIRKLESHPVQDCISTLATPQLQAAFLDLVKQHSPSLLDGKLLWGKSNLTPFLATLFTHMKQPEMLIQRLDIPALRTTYKTMPARLTEFLRGGPQVFKWIFIQNLGADFVREYISKNNALFVVLFSVPTDQWVQVRTFLGDEFVTAQCKQERDEIFEAMHAGFPTVVQREAALKFESSLQVKMQLDEKTEPQYQKDHPEWAAVLPPSPQPLDTLVAWLNAEKPEHWHYQTNFVQASVKSLQDLATVLDKTQDPAQQKFLLDALPTVVDTPEQLGDLCHLLTGWPDHFEAVLDGSTFYDAPQRPPAASSYFRTFIGCDRTRTLLEKDPLAFLKHLSPLQQKLFINQKRASEALLKNKSDWDILSALAPENIEWYLTSHPSLIDPLLESDLQVLTDDKFQNPGPIFRCLTQQNHRKTIQLAQKRIRKENSTHYVDVPPPSHEERFNTLIAILKKIPPCENYLSDDGRVFEDDQFNFLYSLTDPLSRLRQHIAPEEEVDLCITRIVEILKLLHPTKRLMFLKKVFSDWRSFRVEGTESFIPKHLLLLLQQMPKQEDKEDLINHYIHIREQFPSRDIEIEMYFFLEAIVCEEAAKDSSMVDTLLAGALQAYITMTNMSAVGKGGISHAPKSLKAAVVLRDTINGTINKKDADQKGDDEYEQLGSPSDYLEFLTSGILGEVYFRWQQHHRQPYSQASFFPNITHPWPMALARLWGEENLPQPNQFAYRKLLNPFKFIEGVIHLSLYLVRMLVTYLFYRPLLALTRYFSPPSIVHVYPVVRALLFIPIEVPFKIALILVQCITSPIKTMVYPIIEYGRHYSKAKFALMLFAGLAVASLFILASVFSAGALPAALFFLQPFVSTVLWLAQGFGLLAAQIIFGITATLASITVVHHFFFFPEVQKDAARALLKGEAINANGEAVLNPDMSNAYSRLLFNTPRLTSVVEPDQQLSTIAKTFGMNPPAPEKIESKPDLKPNTAHLLSRYRGLLHGVMPDRELAPTPSQANDSASSQLPSL